MVKVVNRGFSMNKGSREEPSITRVARAAGVSLGTVSRVMNGAKSVNPDLRARVQCAAREIGFVHRTPTRRLGVVVGRRNPLLPVGYTHIMTALIDEFAYARGMAVEQFDVANLERAWDSGIAAVIGIVFDDAMLKLRGLPNLPVLSINHPMAELGVHSVYTDHLEQGMMAAQHLLDRGHERVAFLGGLRGEWGVEQRLAGYRAAMSAYGLACDPAWVRFSDDEPVYDIVQRWTKIGVTGILNFSEDVVAETLHVLSNVLRKRIGEDISTITLEDVPLYQYFTPPQTVVRQPLREMARLAVEHALRLSENGVSAASETVDICLRAELVERESVGRPAGADLQGRQPKLMASLT
jgi:LacI family xylobiose transport system transcriptional regulator